MFWDVVVFVVLLLVIELLLLLVLFDLWAVIIDEKINWDDKPGIMVISRCFALSFELLSLLDEDMWLITIGFVRLLFVLELLFEFVGLVIRIAESLKITFNDDFLLVESLFFLFVVILSLKVDIFLEFLLSKEDKSSLLSWLALLDSVERFFEYVWAIMFGGKSNFFVNFWLVAGKETSLLCFLLGVNRQLVAGVNGDVARRWLLLLLLLSSRSKDVEDEIGEIDFVKSLVGDDDVSNDADLASSTSVININFFVVVCDGDGPDKHSSDVDVVIELVVVVVGISFNVYQAVTAAPAEEATAVEAELVVSFEFASFIIC